MSLWIPHVLASANAAADKFARLLDRDGYGPTTVMRMIAAIVDHARAVQLRCDARTHLTEMRRTMCTERLYSGADEEHARIVHGLAHHATTMTRRGLPMMPPPTVELRGKTDTMPWPATHRGEVSEPTRDAGYDLLAALICEVD